jgi:hypothetical protein
MRHELISTRTRRMAVLREVLHGADETSPRRPGRHLETRQRLGLLPTWSFWNRRDVWRSARWFACPVVFFGLQGGFWIPALLNLSFWPRLFVSQSIGVGSLALALGILERYLRRQLTRRRVSAAAAIRAA